MSPWARLGSESSISGPDGLQRVSDEHGAAYLLLNDGWVPGMEPQIDQLLGLPIDRHSPFVVFTERGQKLLGAKYLPKYETLWFFNPHLRIKSS